MSGLRARYAALVEEGELRPDPHQRRAVDLLARIEEELEAPARRGLSLKNLFGKGPGPVRGAYLWGGVGRGKSMLMDLFCDGLDIDRKRRVHFHEFMIEVHGRIRKQRDRREGDPIGPVASALAEEARLLAFDELVVNNAADAMILSRLFTALIEEGVTVVATSNRPPSDLYLNGLNRELFLPFIALVEKRLDVLHLDGPTDYRLDRLGDARLWHVPADDAATKALSEAFFRLTDYDPEDRAHVPGCTLDLGGGRDLLVPKCLKGVAVFSFKRLCGEPRGAADYLAVARRFHTVIIVGIPQMDRDMRNEAQRFVTLIDALYEYKVKLLASAAAAPEELYAEGDGAFEFQRTASRIAEMRSDDYLAEGHGEADSPA